MGQKYREAPARAISSCEGFRELVIVGGGPAGTALMVAASRMGSLEAMASAGLTVIHDGPKLGGGNLANYAITADSSAETFLTAVGSASGADLHALADCAAAKAIASHCGPAGGSPVPLTEVATFLDVIGSDLARRVHAAGGSVLLQHTAVSVQRHDNGWVTRTVCADGVASSLYSRSVVIATGGRQTNDRLDSEHISGTSLAKRAGGRLLASQQLLSHGGATLISERMAELSKPRVVVLGSSASALTSCCVLLSGKANLTFGTITLVHRRALRLFYSSVEAALADGYDQFNTQDVCPLSGFVYRLAGLRMEARALARSALGIGGKTVDIRLRLHRFLGGDDIEAARLLDEADLIVYALGYQPRALPVIDESGAPVSLATGAGESLVDSRCRVRDRTGGTLPGLFAMGLGAGFVPSADLGGEPSFSGRANGLWLWQNDAGAMIVDQVQALTACSSTQ